MTTLFVDSSAIYAWLDRLDAEHERIKRTWEWLAAENAPLMATNYVIVETVALCQARLGTESVHAIVERVLPLLSVQWVTEPDHDSAMATLLAANRRDLSLVDCVSFAAMRRLGVSRAFTLDDHFREQGFECLPV